MTTTPRGEIPSGKTGERESLTETRDPGTPAVALVTARAARGLDADLPVLLAAFAAAGAHAEI